jgi:hypothetical protein
MLPGRLEEQFFLWKRGLFDTILLVLFGKRSVFFPF